MDARRWEQLLRQPARATTRRRVLGTFAAGVALSTFGRVSLRAQEASPGAVEGDWAAVETLVRSAEATGGVVGVAVRGAAGELFSYNGDRRFRAGGTIKLPIMIEASRRIDAGALSLDDRYRLRDEDRVPGAGVLGDLHAGLELTVADLVYLMIAVGDNTATNLVIDRVGLDAVNATMRSLGMTDSVLGRRLGGQNVPQAGAPENWATPRDFALAVQAIVAGTAASPESCARMLDTLEGQGEIRRISRFLVTGPGIRWGSRPGDLLGVVNDVGYVTTDRGTLSLAVFCEDLPDLDAAERAIGEIARAALSLTGIVPFERGSPVPS